MNINDLPEAYRNAEWQVSPVSAIDTGLAWEVVINNPETGEAYRLGYPFSDRSLAERIAADLREGGASTPSPASLTRLSDHTPDQ